MPMIKRLLPILLLAATFPFITGLDACLGLCDFENDPACEDPTRAQISGTITVPESGGESVGFTRVSGPLAVALKEAMTTAMQDELARRPAPTKRGLRLPERARNVVDKDKTREEHFRPGEIIVRALEPMRERKAELAQAIELHLIDAGFAAEKGKRIDVDVRLCGSEHRCTAHLRWADDADVGAGKPLDMSETAEAVALLSSAPFLKYAEKNLILQMLAQPNDEFFTLQWHYAAIDLPTAWDITLGDGGIVAAVIDTGVLYAHPDLSARLTNHSADLIDDPGTANDGDGRDDDGDDSGDNACGEGCHSHHGSHVAGTMGADTDNGLMVSGITWEGQILPVRVLGVGGGSLADIADGILWAVGQSVDGVSDNPTPADVINMSLGGFGESQAMNEAIADAAATGCIVVVAAGNDNTDATEFTPANAPDAITVASHGNTGGGRSTPAKASYSNFGNKVDFAAPGGEQAEDVDGDGQGDGVLSTIEDFVAFYQGTSMAAPHVAGISMLLKSVNPGIQQEEVRALLADTANPDLDCPEGCGAGRVSAAAALLGVNGPVDGARVIASPSFLRVGIGQTQTNVVFKNIGNAPTDVDLSIGGENRDLCDVLTDTATVDGGGTLSRIVNIARNANADDRGECTITATSAEGATEARVVWTPDAIQALTQVDVGAVRVDGGDLRVERIVSTTEIEQFQYKLFNLTPGTYLVIGLVDVNGNDSYDDDVDAVGIFVPPNNEEGDACTEAACGEVTVVEGETFAGADFLVVPGFDGAPGEPPPGGTGDGELGDACAGSSECGGGLYCETVLDTGVGDGGYCTTDCGDTGECGGAGVCASVVDFDGTQYDICLRSCVDDSDCRVDDGYFCDPTDNTCFPAG